jgi:hypothetical protein
MVSVFAFPVPGFGRTFSSRNALGNRNAEPETTFVVAGSLHYGLL